MNKKRLSVVMAGAMLASSVAPVLAAEVVKSEHSAAEIGLLQKELRELLTSKVYSNVEENAPAGKTDVRNDSVYAIYVNGVNQGLDKANKLHDQDAWQAVFNAIEVGAKVEVYNKGFEEVEGIVYGYKTVKGGKLVAYTKEAELKELVQNFYNDNKYDHNDQTQMKSQFKQFVKFAKYDTITNEAVIQFDNDVTVSGTDEKDTLRIKADGKQPKFKYEKARFTSGSEWDTYFYNDANGVSHALIDDGIEAKDFYGFTLTSEKTEDKVEDIKSELVREYTITPGGYDLALEDLYDGLMLTEKGHEFFQMIEDEVATGRTVTLKLTDEAGEHYTVDVKIDLSGEWVSQFNHIYSKLKEYKNGYRFQVVLDGVKTGDGTELAEEVYTITGKDKTNTARVMDWLRNAQARVDILAGANRYETAVEIAKEYTYLHRNTTSKLNKANIVLVNGNALVDGLAAAPLAASLEKDGLKTPVLLTEADALPKATKAYLKEVIGNVQVGELKNVTIHLVGGESVLNKSLERELRSLGFNVERYGGDNREETSLEVAEAVEANGGSKTKAFVVGGEGEADAMSIASVAAATHTPIIVGAKNGVSEDAAYELRGKTVTVIGGKTVVTNAEYNTIKAEANGISRIYGDNRKATNAEIIKKYYKNGYVGTAKNVIVAKDGQNRKSDLVDALAAANMAATKKAPIVLATNSLSKAQESALESNAKQSYALYQVGIGVNKDKVVRIIAQNLRLSNR